MTWGARRFELGHTTRGDLVRFGVMPQGDTGDAQIDSETALDDLVSLQRYPSNSGPTISANPNCRFAGFDGGTEVDLHSMGAVARPSPASSPM